MTSDRVAATACEAFGASTPVFETYDSREVGIGSLKVVRALPARSLRLVGPWCFLDRIGPLTFAEGSPVNLAPHPHIGLQTVTWLLDGEMLHDDSLGSQALLRAGGVNVMTAGSGITHAERTPATNSGRLNGAQLWVALPSEHKDTAAFFQYVPEVPPLALPGATVRLFAGDMDKTSSPARHFSELIGADVEVHRHASAEIPLQASFEHAILLLGGDCFLDGRQLRENALTYLGRSRSSITLNSVEGARALLLGGPPFPETILMWWNFVARTPEEIAQAREDWQQHRHFGDVEAYGSARLEAPPIVRIAHAEAVS